MLFAVGSDGYTLSWGANLSHYVGITCQCCTIQVQYKVSAIYFITDFSLVNPVIAARSPPPQNLANPVHPSTKAHIFDF